MFNPKDKYGLPDNFEELPVAQQLAICILAGRGLTYE